MTKKEPTKLISEDVLLRIYRQYSKDESVTLLIDEMRKARFRIGELESENAERGDVIYKLGDKINALKKEIATLKNTSEAEIISDLRSQIRQMQDTIKLLTKK
jgi:predicted RNA-binding protein YlqC (UPF0109 family)